MKRIATLLGALVVLAPLTASAIEFGTVTKIYRSAASVVEITGIPVGSNVAEAHYVNGDPTVVESCERAAYILMTHPGRYVIEVGGSCSIRPAS